MSSRRILLSVKETATVKHYESLDEGRAFSWPDGRGNQGATAASSGRHQALEVTVDGSQSRCYQASDPGTRPQLASQPAKPRSTALFRKMELRVKATEMVKASTSSYRAV